MLCRIILPPLGLLLTFFSGNLIADTRIDRILQLNAEGEFAQAYSLGQNILPDLAGSASFDMAFGRSALAVGEYDQALFAFERVLMLNPSAPLPRLELARAHFELGNLASARRHFNRVLDGTPRPPPQVAQRIQWYLAAIDAREEGRSVAARDINYQFYLGARMGVNSNITSVNGEPVNVGLFAFQPEKLSDIFQEIYLGSNHIQLQTERWGFFAGGEVSRRFYLSEKEQEEYTYSIRGGPIILAPSWRLIVPVQFQHTGRDDSSQVSVTSLGTDFQYRLNQQSSLNLIGQVSEVNYGSESNRNVDSYNLSGRYIYRPTSRMQLSAGPVWGQDRGHSGTRDDLDRHLLGAQAGFRYNFDDHHSVRLNYRGTRVEYADEYASPLAFAFDAKERKDSRHQMTMNWMYRPSQEWLVELAFTQIINRSNFELHTYDRTEVSWGVRREW